MPRRSPATGARPGSRPRLGYMADPLAQGVRRLGQKWTLLLLRDMAFLRLARFTEFLRNNPGLTPRVLSRRLREMQAERLVRRTGTGRATLYALTPRGQDAVYILLAFLRYGMKYHRGPESDDPLS
jgi:DNA-binding HxlR family transcriptional regulator